ncbi:hypothetical protein BACPLE_03506 [Phocaeicola plebeius DSM 17135]|uniref:Uncharacterized protein n=1 Tax=Phocaeicola plebeius (strain DSM 17135 / JCM 12973 / CCUG 54634 / M2) TaxID=484018 RepID=B5D3B2_PHOPM|nr:hypothetical protein BACPLE_03506 [Phocaeicola plebeius DSM 17135]
MYQDFLSWKERLLFRGRYGPHGYRNAKDKMLNYKGDLILRME